MASHALSFKTDAGAVLLNSWALRVFDWILTHPEAGIRVSSNSWGSGDGTDHEPDNPVNVATKMLYDAGVTVAFAASNSEGTADSMPAYEIFEVGLGHLDAHEAVRAAERGKVRFPPSTGGKTPEWTQTSETGFSGTVVAANTWALAQCPDSLGLLNHHEFSVTSGTDAIYIEISWASTTDLLYLRLYDLNCEVACESAALLDIDFVNHRALLVTTPQPGTWTVGVYGRINAPTAYEGVFATYDKN
jgi:serine protease AprX